MTPLGKLLSDKMINKSELGRRTNISKQRMIYLTLEGIERLHATEAFRIARALKMSVDKLLIELYKDDSRAI